MNTISKNFNNNELELLTENLSIKPIPHKCNPVFVHLNENKDTFIIDKRNDGFNINELINRLKNKNVIKVNQQIIEPKINEISNINPQINNKPKIKKIKRQLILEEEEEEEKKVENELNKDEILIQPKKRKTNKKEKGIVELGDETMVQIGDTLINKRLPINPPTINIKVSSYFMNNREIFINFINGLFEPYKDNILNEQKSITCDDLAKEGIEMNLLTHQKIVRDYLNLYTPYRGLLIYHGLGAGKTASAVSIAEGFKNTTKVIVMTPASLKRNFLEEIKKYGDLLYRKNQFWEFISIQDNPETLASLSSILSLPKDYIKRKQGAWLVNISKSSNYNDLSSNEKKSLENQIDEMIQNKYTFINYNGLRRDKFKDLTNNYETNIFDNSVVIIDEAHNLISRIVNKINKVKKTNSKIQESLSLQLYEFLLRATNCRIVLLSGTPIINFPNEIGILFNILRGYIKSWEFTLNIETTNKLTKDSLIQMFSKEKILDYIDFSPSSKILTITRNPYGFESKITERSGYKGVTNEIKENIDLRGNISDEDFLKRIVKILKKNDIQAIPRGTQYNVNTALPDSLEEFMNLFIDKDNGKVTNIEKFKKRIIGLTSYFKSAQEELLPKYNKITDFNVVKIPMSNYQFKIYEEARIDERKMEKSNKKSHAKVDSDGIYIEPTSTYRIFSRLFCNFVMPKPPGRPTPGSIKLGKGNENSHVTNINLEIEPLMKKLLENIPELKARNDWNNKLNNFLRKNLNEYVIFIEQSELDLQDIDNAKEKLKNITSELEKLEEIIENKKILKNEIKNIINVIKNYKIVKNKKDDFVNEKNISLIQKEAEDIEIDNDNFEKEREGDEILEKIGDQQYKKAILEALNFLKNNALEYLTPDKLEIYSPKFLTILENIQSPENIGLNLIYSQFRSMEGIGILSLVLEANGFVEFKLKKIGDSWEINIAEKDKGKPTFALYTGTEEAEEREIIRNIYNGSWNYIPTNITKELKKISNNNNLGEIIKILMITAAGSEGINLKNTRYVHLMEPYWHPVRIEQVIGRARRICSHKDLPIELQTVEVYLYLMTFTKDQLNSDEAIELKVKDLSKRKPIIPLTSDEALFEISNIKEELTSQLLKGIKETAIDCAIHIKSNSKENLKCLSFGKPSVNSFSYNPNFAQDENDKVAALNKVTIQWEGREITFNGKKMILREETKEIYDFDSYIQALQNPGYSPILLGILEKKDGKFRIIKSTI